MEIKSDASIIRQTSQQMKAQCGNLGQKVLEFEGETNLPGIQSLLSLFEENNDIYSAYRQALHDDSVHVQTIGDAFVKFDHTIMK